jgi:hypothetical protein
MAAFEALRCWPERHDWVVFINMCRCKEHPEGTGHGETAVYPDMPTRVLPLGPYNNTATLSCIVVMNRNSAQHCIAQLNGYYVPYLTIFSNSCIARLKVQHDEALLAQDELRSFLDMVNFRYDESRYYRRAGHVAMAHRRPRLRYCA